MKKQDPKVFQGAAFNDGNQVSMIVAATSQRAAVEALERAGIRTSLSHFAKYWSATGNREQIAMALSAPGEVFASSAISARDYKPLTKSAAPAATKAAKKPKVPTDPEERKEYDRQRREKSDAAKKKSGERRLTTWLPKDAADALDVLTGGSRERGVVLDAIVKALVSAAAQHQPSKRKAG